MSKTKATWITLCKQELSIADLERIRSEAIGKWERAETAINYAEVRRREAEDIVRGCNARMRFLRMLESQ